jgi:hypothetical protein
LYVLALDESGTHGTASCLVIAGLALHELDVRPLEQQLDQVLAKYLDPLGLSPQDHELHATDLSNPTRGALARGGHPPKPPSPWLTVERATRQAIIAEAYAVIASYTPVDPGYPPALIGAIVERKHKKFQKADETAYDHVLHRFDDMLLRRNRSASSQQRGLVLHDTRQKMEKPVQQWARRWQRTGSRLDYLAQVPVFADSKASRLLQAADFVAYAIYRHYSVDSRDPSLAEVLWALVDTLPDGRMSGVIHLTPAFATGRCDCPPCVSRP